MSAEPMSPERLSTLRAWASDPLASSYGWQNAVRDLLAEVDRLRSVEAAASHLIALGWSPPPLSELGSRVYALRAALSGEHPGADA